MIGASDLYRVPRSDAQRASVDVARYVRLEYGDGDLAWTFVTRQDRNGHGSARRQWFAHLFRLGRPVSPLVPEGATLQTGLAAVHFDRPDSYPLDGVRARQPTNACIGIVKAVALMDVGQTCDEAYDVCHLEQ